MKIKNLVITGLEGLYNGDNINDYILVSNWCKYGRKENRFFYHSESLKHPWENKINYKNSYKLISKKTECFLIIIKDILNKIDMGSIFII